MRIPARQFETAVIDRVGKALSDPVAIASACGIELGSNDWCRLLGAAGEPAVAGREAILTLVRMVTVTPASIQIACSSQRLAAHLGLTTPADDHDIVLTTDASLKRSGQVVKLVRQNGMPITAAPNAALVRLVALAHKWWGEIRRDGMSVRELAERVGVVPAYATRVLRLAFLSPKVTDAILGGSVNALIGCRVLTRQEGVAIIEQSWADQERLLLGVA